MSPYVHFTFLSCLVQVAHGFVGCGCKSHFRAYLGTTIIELGPKRPIFEAVIQPQNCHVVGKKQHWKRKYQSLPKFNCEDDISDGIFGFCLVLVRIACFVPDFSRHGSQGTLVWSLWGMPMSLLFLVSIPVWVLRLRPHRSGNGQGCNLICGCSLARFPTTIAGDTA